MTRPRKRMVEVRTEREAQLRVQALTEIVRERLEQLQRPRRRNAPPPWDDD